jgi:hypothetical protein
MKSIHPNLDLVARLTSNSSNKEKVKPKQNLKMKFGKPIKTLLRPKNSG